MLGSLIVEVQDFEKSKYFYDETLKILGYFCPPHGDTKAASWKLPLAKTMSFGIKVLTSDKKPNTNLIFSFIANSREEVDRWYTKCLELGASGQGISGGSYDNCETHYQASIKDLNSFNITVYYNHDNDDEGRDIINQLGHMSKNATYLEDEVFEIIKQVSKFSKFEKDIQKFRLADQARHLRKHLEKLYGLPLVYMDKNNDWSHIENVLKEVEKIAEKRNVALHSKITSTGKGHIQTIASKKDPNQITEKAITSQNIEIISKELQELQMSVAFLEPLINDLSMVIAHNKLV